MTGGRATATPEIGRSSGNDWSDCLGVLPRSPALDRFPTPIAVVDLDTLERNIGVMEASRPHPGMRIRPHVKGHKCSAIARKQVAVHGAGVTCATTTEALAMVSAGIDDVLIANVVTDRTHLARIADLASRARLTVVLDSIEALGLLSSAVGSAGTTVGVVIEQDIGMGRNGVRSPEEGLLLADACAGHTGIEVRGVMAYEGHLVGTVDRAERAQRVTDAFRPALELLVELRRRGFEASIFTGGSTSTHGISGQIPEMTDLQAGTYALMDASYVRLTPEFQPALAIIASVLTVRGEGTVVTNAGIKRLGTDQGRPQLLGFEAENRYVAEEHSVFNILDGHLPRVGDRVALIPGHACTTMPLYPYVLACRGGTLQEVLTIDGRESGSPQ